jgi:hypothetical protein
MKIITIHSALLMSFLASWATFASAEESLVALKARINIESLDAGIENGDLSVLSELPAKRYKKGLAGFMQKFHVLPHPEHSFTQCGPGVLLTPVGPRSGCIVSIKLAKKKSDGDFEDIGIRIEYGIELGAKSFKSNNSAYAQHAIQGDGMLEAQF